MTWAVVRGKYKEGVIELLEKAPAAQEGEEVLILLPARPRLGEAGGIWRRIKQEITREMPELLGMSEEARLDQFERLSRLIAERMPYRSPEEFERAMRGDEHGLVGY